MASVDRTRRHRRSGAEVLQDIALPSEVVPEAAQPSVGPQGACVEPDCRHRRNGAELLRDVALPGSKN